MITDGNGKIERCCPQEVLQRISSEIESKRNAPQELWEALRCFIVANLASVPDGLMHDVVKFCLAVFDSIEPNVTSEERSRRVAHVNGLVVPLNLQIGQVVQTLTEKDNAFIGRWSIVTVSSMLALRQPNPNAGLALSPFVAFDLELQQTDHPELVLSIWLYSLYTFIFALAYGTIPADLLGVVSFCIGLAAYNENRNH